jgi:Ca-activated chloride channel family protein
MRLTSLKNAPQLRVLAFLAAALIPVAGTPAFSQSTAATQTQPAMPGNLPDPTQPETQPRLDVDHDPIPSPDREVAPPPEETATQPSSATSAPGAKASGNSATDNGLQKRQDGTYVLHADVDEVLLNCTVVDEKGQTANDLHQRDFRVWEDGVEQTVNSLQRQDQPVSMGILVDDSGSMIDKRGIVNLAAMRLLKASNPGDSVFVVNFADKAYLDQGFTSDLVALNRGLNRNDPRGMTAMYDAVAASADQLAHHATKRKQVLLIITDGGDNASELNLEQTVRRVQNLAGPVVYTIGLLFDNGRVEAERTRQALERLSEETGGVAYFPPSLDDMNAVAAQVAYDIRNQYIVAYHSSKPVNLGGYRSVRVEARSPSHQRLSVRTRHGYFANTDNQAPPAK